MKKYIITCIVIVAVIWGVVFLKPGTKTPSSMAASSSNASNPQPLNTGAPSSSTSSPNNIAVSYKDGTYIGPSVDVSYGIVQVAAIISGNKITDIKLLSLPSDRQHSLDLSNFAGPLLKKEAITAQSSSVDIASGATLTSEGFIQSLQNALDQAKL